MMCFFLYTIKAIWGSLDWGEIRLDEKTTGGDPVESHETDSEQLVGPPTVKWLSICSIQPRHYARQCALTLNRFDGYRCIDLLGEDIRKRSF